MSVEPTINAKSFRTPVNVSIAYTSERCLCCALRLSSLAYPVLLLFLLASPAWAVDPKARISQYGHTAWRMQDGFVPNPTAVTQTSDGYIWIGSSIGLFRFDGVKFTQWTPPSGQSLPSKIPYKLLGSRDGTLWIGTANGLARLKDGQLFNYVTVPRGPGVSSIIEDEAGTIWITRYFVNDGLGPLCRIEGDSLKCFNEKDGIKTRYALAMTKDAAGNIWFGSDRLTRWAPGSVTTYFEKNLEHRSAEGIHCVTVAPNGSVLVGFDGTGRDLGVQILSDGKWKSFVIPGFNGAEIRTSRMYTDRNGALWVGTDSDGIYRIYKGAVDHYANANGLTGNSVTSIHEDVEGNLWVVTDKGIDVFRDTPVITFSVSEGLIGTDVGSILALNNGLIWVGDSEALNVINSGRISAIQEGKGLPGHSVEGMFEDSKGTTWVGIDDELMIRNGDQFTKIKNSDGKPFTHAGIVVGLTEDVEGNVWALTTVNEAYHLIQIRDRRVRQNILVDDFLKNARRIAADRVSGVWIGANDGKMIRYRNRNIETVALATAENRISPRHMFVDEDNSVWTATTKGLYRWKDGEVITMDSRNGLPDCLPFFYAIKDDGGSLWIYAACGLMNIPAAELAKWLKEPQRQLSVRTFGPLEGAFPSYSETGGAPKVTKSGDGRLWFAGSKFVQMVDANRSYINPIPPPVHIENLVADRTSYRPSDKLHLPPLTRDLEIDYTALSFVIPQHVKFRYKLDGHDQDWQNVGTRRQAFYSDLRPGDYTFHVVASNNDGVWNETGATLSFHIAHAWYQTGLFQALVVITFLLFCWLIYSLRVRHVSRVLSARFDERLAERTRVAREMHDTFLQTVQGSKFVADHALKDTSDHARMVRAMEQLSAWLGQATEEGRAALNSLRASTTERNDLAGAFRRAIDECRGESSIEISFSVKGDFREMHPVVRDEIYRIGYEAIRNSCAHSGGDRLEVTLEYAHDLTLRISDNGAGIASEIVVTGKEGHFGLRGMRERAERIGGKFTLVSAPDSGTAITLVVPGRIIFRSPRPDWSERLNSLFSRN